MDGLTDGVPTAGNRIRSPCFRDLQSAMLKPRKVFDEIVREYWSGDSGSPSACLGHVTGFVRLPGIGHVPRQPVFEDKRSQPLGNFGATLSRSKLEWLPVVKLAVMPNCTRNLELLPPSTS